MNEEEAVGIVFAFNLAQPRVINAPIGLLPARLEEIAFGEVGAAIGRQLSQFFH